MSKLDDDFSFEYQYDPMPDAEENIAQAWDLILKLILEDYNSELQQNNSESEQC